MDENHLDAPGDRAEPDQLVTAKGRDLHRLLANGSIEYATVVECRRDGGSDVVVFDVEVELGQLRVHAIERSERIAAVFGSTDSFMPETLALRAGFPRVPHLNLRPQEFPRSLCLYDQPYSELKRQWTSPRYVERVRSWLAMTAKGVLHDDDQPLEPLLWGHVGQIVLPSDLLTTNDKAPQLIVSATSVEPGDIFLVAEHHKDDARPGVPYVPFLLTCPPQHHGIIRFKPRTLQELSELTAATGFDLLGELRQEISNAKEVCDGDDAAAKRFLASSAILLLSLPKTRHEGGSVESADLWAFLAGSSVRQVGIDIGLWMDIDGQLGKEPFAPDDKTGSNVELDLLNPLFSLSSSVAATLNGLDPTVNQPAVVVVGAGALGSQVITNWARMGLTCCTTVDEDRLFPHNLARHSLPGHAVGFLKADSVSLQANELTDMEGGFQSIAVDVLRPGDKKEQLSDAFSNADVIVDMSASVAVGRALANDNEATARRISLFMNPTGSDLVMLAEDAERSCRLDALEMQYYRALVADGNLAGHFTPTDSRRRYGQSCRDITSRMPNDAIALHAAVGTRALRNAVNDDNAAISVWRSAEDLQVERIAIDPSPVIQCDIADWTVRFDAGFLARLHDLRQEKLPNETGGVLIGSFDLERRIAYLVDTVPSPADSDEWPTLYIRGSKGLKRNVMTIIERTDGALHYVGEWHSHPRGASTMPSQDDLKVFGWLTELMDRDGFPALMMIVGDIGRTSCFIGTMSQQENLLPNE